MRNPGAVFAVALIAVASGAVGCAPVSVSHYQSARPIGKGNSQFGAGLSFQKNGAHGTDRDHADGDPVLEHHGTTLPFDMEYHYGLTERTEVNGQLYFTGAKLGVRHTWLDTPHFKGAIEVAGGGFSGGATVSSGEGADAYKADTRVSGTYVDIPLTFSVHAGDRFAVYGGPLITRFDALTKFKEKDNGMVTDQYSRRVGVFQPGAFLGLCIGQTVQLSPGMTFYLENTEYPIETISVGGGKTAFFAYPWLGLTYATGQKPRKNPN